jgi:predicted phage baseplate assembly protein
MYHQFRESLLSALSNAGVPALHKLTTRNSDDFTVALLDAWAVASDVLTFYQERIANESYLHTATERLSVLQLARHIGYELRPGVAASTYLAFTLDEATAIPQPLPGMAQGPNPMTPVTILDRGIKVQSVPGPDEKPQTFETIETLHARPQWNSIRPRLSRAQSLDPENGFFILQDINVDIKKGDVVLIDSDYKRALKKILSIEINKEAKTTKLFYDTKSSLPPFTESTPIPDGTIGKFSNETKLEDAVVSEILKYTWKEEDLSALLQAKKWSLKDLIDGIEKQLHPESSGKSGLSVFRKTVSPFGYNAAKQVTYDGRIPKLPAEWKEWDLNEKCETIHLDNEYKEIVPGSFVAVMKPVDDVDNAKIYKIKTVHVGARTAYGISSKSTSIGISTTGCWYNEKKKKLSAIRGITVLAQNESLFLADLPIEDVVLNDLVTLDRWYPGLRKGQKIILTGQRTDLPGAMASEVMELNDVFVVKGYTVIRFTQSLLNRYIRSSITLNANVALATHGETVHETLGSGDAHIPFQRFVLRQPPLTYTSSSAETGVETTLKVYINDILWHEAETFYGHTSEERIYITRLDNEGKTTVIFGDGITGARLPSGSENIKATYRKGIGTGGLMKANQLSQLLTRPLGVKAALNPLPATGAADAENLGEARHNAPLTLLTLGRVVSLKDYEDFARAFPGIEKSLATWTWKNQRRYIFLTVAGVNGATVSKSDALHKNLLKAIADAGDSRVPVVLESYRPRFFRFSANLKIDPDYQSEKVLAAAEERLRRDFSFQSRSFGQPVSLSEVIASIQQVKGIVAVDVDYLYYADGPKGSLPPPLLTASIPVTEDEVVLPAELLTLDVAPLDLKIIP